MQESWQKWKTFSSEVEVGDTILKFFFACQSCVFENLIVFIGLMAFANTFEDASFYLISFYMMYFRDVPQIKENSCIKIMPVNLSSNAPSVSVRREINQIWHFNKYYNI